jgi:hypothetical protein
VKLRSCERPKARGGRILDVFDRRATQGRDANARFHDGSQPVRCSRRLQGGQHSAQLGGVAVLRCKLQVVLIGKGLVAGVVLFRILDQWKPWPARG